MKKTLDDDLIIRNDIGNDAPCISVTGRWQRREVKDDASDLSLGSRDAGSLACDV